jgi:hypothetical protein
LALCACRSSKNSGEETALDIRTMMLESDHIDLTARVTAITAFASRLCLRYTGDAQAGTLEVLEPATIAGLKAAVSVTGGTLDYDGASLDTGGVTADGLSPAQCVPVLISQWRSGYISGCNFEKLGDDETLAFTTDITASVSERTWFDVGTLLPIKSELYDGGVMVLSCRFETIIID